MDKRMIMISIAGLFVGLMAGVLGPKMFGAKPPGTTITQQQSAPVPQQAPGTNYTLQISELKRRLKTNSNDVGLLVQLGNTYFDSNMYPESIAAYEKALALKPGNPNVLTDLGVMYRRNGQSDEAVFRFKEAMKADATHLQSRMNLGIVYLYDFNDTFNARAVFEDALRISPSGPQADQVRGLIAQIDSQQ
jgi:cytochrome c-type biogenesis protein CcmH/NrfG